MHQTKVPILPISERTTVGELPETFLDVIEVYENAGAVPPLFMFEPREESLIPGPPPTVSDAPEELLVCPLESSIRQAVFEALKRVESREPKYPTEAPLKAFFRKMAEVPITAFSITLSFDDMDAISVFFLRTPFTVNAFLHEIQQPID
jgi:hypothetical protein